MGVPIIASDLATLRAHFTDEAVRYVPGGSPMALADAIRSLAADPAAAGRLGAEAQRQAAALCVERAGGSATSRSWSG